MCRGLANASKLTLALAWRRSVTASYWGYRGQEVTWLLQVMGKPDALWSVSTLVNKPYLTVEMTSALRSPFGAMRHSLK